MVNLNYMMQDGVTWLLNQPEQNLPTILADQGFDVWISNTRGTRFSNRHLSLQVNQKVSYSLSLSLNACMHAYIHLFFHSSLLSSNNARRDIGIGHGMNWRNSIFQQSLIMCTTKQDRRYIM